MKNVILALAVLSTLSVAACTNTGGDWTPMSAGRTAGEGTVAHSTNKADDSFSGSLRK